jgi:predicted ATPase/class 3 adenylate cyclase
MPSVIPFTQALMAELPAGTVTFLFTDIVGSTRLLQELGDAYADALGQNRRVLREAFAQHRGVEVDTQGDAFFVAFARAKDALAAARDAQAALNDGPIRVRIGVHTGEPLLSEEGYVGIDVHRAARIAAVGHGGQILVSRSTRELVGADGLRDLGEHRLKDLTAPERIYQLGDGVFPPLKSLNRTNLPVAATPLVGRDRELGDLLALFRDGTRLVTLTGAGGSGKTRLALQVAAELVDDFRDSVFFVSLAPVQDSGLVAPTIAQAAGVRELDDFRETEALLVLDNFEHVLPAAIELSALLSNAPHVKLLATSRVRLRMSGEREFALEPLAHPEAVGFFVERARAVKRDLRFDDAVSEICRRLDGLPLALELAASRVKVLDPPLLLERLERRLAVLTGGPRDAPERQQTLRATIEWSYELLDPNLQQAFRRLAVFRGTFSLEAAEVVGGATLDDVAGLVDWNLLKPIGQGRFLMLETIREYGVELFEASSESDGVHERQVAFFLALVEEAEPQLTGPEQRQWYDRLRLEHDNLRGALAYACDTGDGERALMLAGTIWRFWWNRGQTAEAAHWYERAFAVGGPTSAVARARAVFGAAHVAESRGDPKRALVEFEQAAHLLREIGETRWLILALAHLANALRGLGSPERAESVLNEALALARESGDVRGAAVVKSNLGYNLLVAGEDERAAPLLAEALEGNRAVGDVYGTAMCSANVAAIALRRGDVQDALPNLRESLRLCKSIGDTHSLAGMLALAGAAAFARGDAATSSLLCGAAEALCRAHGFELETVERQFLQETSQAVRNLLGGQADEAWAAGAELDVAAAVELALSALE